MPCSEYLKYLEDNLPEQLTAKDLVKFGIFGSIATVFRARAEGRAPDYLELPNGRIVFPKKEIIAFFKRYARKGGENPKKKQKPESSKVENISQSNSEEVQKHA